MVGPQTLVGFLGSRARNGERPSMRRMRIISIVVVGVAAFAALVLGTQHWTGAKASASAPRYTAVPGGEKGEQFAAMDAYWNDRLTYPTGRFNPAWLRAAARQDARIARGVPAAAGPNGSTWTGLGPQPERMDGCTGCFNYHKTEGRINAIVVDPTTTTNGSIVAYAATVGGGVWKTTNCCSTSTTWTVTTDDPLIAAITIDTLAIDPANHNTIYAGTGDLNYGSFSMGSQGILKSTDAGATWTLLGEDVFGPGYDQPPGEFPQYDAVGKVRVDPNDPTRSSPARRRASSSPTTAAPTGRGRARPTPSTPNDRTSRASSWRTWAPPRGSSLRSASAVLPPPCSTTSGRTARTASTPATCQRADARRLPRSRRTRTVSSTARREREPVPNRCAHERRQRRHYVNSTTGDQLGRIDIAVAPSNPNVIYAQVQSIAPNSGGSCGGGPGCQLGVWATTNGGTNLVVHGRIAGAARSAAAVDYPQNWYDQGIAVDPNNADRLYVDTFDVWLATRTGSSFTDVTCGYNGGTSVHVDQHALAFVHGSSSIMLVGSDGGAFATTQANLQPDRARQLLQHGRRPEHDRVLLGRHQRQLRRPRRIRPPRAARRTTARASSASRATQQAPRSGR